MHYYVLEIQFPCSDYYAFFGIYDTEEEAKAVALPYITSSFDRFVVRRCKVGEANEGRAVGHGGMTDKKHYYENY